MTLESTQKLNGTPRWTFSGWLWGIVGLYAAMGYIAWWYFLYAIPLLLVFSVLTYFISSFVESTMSSLSMASMILSPLSIWFLLWQFFYFVMPAYFDIIRLSGLFFQRAHHLTPMTALATVRVWRVRASSQFLSVLRWFRLGRKLLNKCK
jgi:ABC-type Na+ efflux pump permease subunit